MAENNTKEELEKLAQELIKLGEDSGEMNFWLDFWPVMGEQARDNIFSNLREELSILKALAK